MRKIILEMEYIYKIYQMLKFFKRIALFYPEMILRPFNILLWRYKQYRFFTNIWLFETKEINFKFFC